MRSHTDCTEHLSSSLLLQHRSSVVQVFGSRRLFIAHSTRRLVGWFCSDTSSLGTVVASSFVVRSVIADCLMQLLNGVSTFNREHDMCILFLPSSQSPLLCPSCSAGRINTIQPTLLSARQANAVILNTLGVSGLFLIHFHLLVCSAYLKERIGVHRVACISGKGMGKSPRNPHP